jgi:opacity protein-like surface antigen
MKILKARWIGLFGFFILGAASFSPSAAAGPGTHTIGVMVGQVWPAGEIGKDVDAAVAPGLFYEYSSSDVFSLYASGIHSNHSEDNLKITSTNVGIKANLFYFDRLSPYALLGAGLYFVNKRFGNEIASKTNFGLHLGLGAELDLSDHAFVGLEFDLHNLFTSRATLAQGKVDVSGRWTGFFLRGGYRF